MKAIKVMDIMIEARNPINLKSWKNPIRITTVGMKAIKVMDMIEVLNPRNLKSWTKQIKKIDMKIIKVMDMIEVQSQITMGRDHPNTFNTPIAKNQTPNTTKIKRNILLPPTRTTTNIMEEVKKEKSMKIVTRGKVVVDMKATIETNQEALNLKNQIEIEPIEMKELPNMKQTATRVTGKIDIVRNLKNQKKTNNMTRTDMVIERKDPTVRKRPGKIDFFQTKTNTQKKINKIEIDKTVEILKETNIQKNIILMDIVQSQLIAIPMIVIDTVRNPTNMTEVKTADIVRNLKQSKIDI